MIFLVTALIEFSEDIDYVVVVEANTPQQALDYALTHNLVNVNQEVKVITPKDIYYLNDRASKGEVKTKIKYNQIELPVFKNQEIGELVVKKQNKTIASYSLYLEKNVKKMNFLDKLLRVYKSLI